METGNWREEDEEETLQEKEKVEKSNKETKSSPQQEAKSWNEHAKKFHSFGPDRDRMKPSEWWILL
jgi:hypothetical protein